MSETARQLAVDAVAELYADRQRIAAALADLRTVMPESQPFAAHNPDCWRWHARCLAVRTIRTLTGEDPT